MIHYLTIGSGGMRTACMEYLPFSAAFTRDFRMVTCERCKRTKVIKRAALPKKQSRLKDGIQMELFSK